MTAFDPGELQRRADYSVEAGAFRWEPFNNQQGDTTVTTTDPWEGFSTPGSGEWPDPFKFDTVGVSIAGTITNVRKAEFDGKGVPELWIMTDDGERSVLCGQANLMTQLLEHRPLVGDRIAIVYTGQRKAKLGMAKLFDVSVARGDGAPVTLDGSGSPGTSAPKTAADLL